MTPLMFNNRVDGIHTYDYQLGGRTVFRVFVIDPNLSKVDVGNEYAYSVISTEGEPLYTSEAVSLPVALREAEFEIMDALAGNLQQMVSNIMDRLRGSNVITSQRDSTGQEAPRRTGGQGRATLPSTSTLGYVTDGHGD